MDKEFLYREILNQIAGFGCYFDYHQLHDFIIGERTGEFRLSGKFGNGFKLYRRNFDGLIWYGQYSEDETFESKTWINKHNAILEDLTKEIK